MKHGPRWGKALFWGLVLLAVPWTYASDFGQNKVQYQRFRWSFVQTEHFDIYFPQGADPISRFAAQHVEEMYASVSKTVGHQLTERVPIILHNTHAEFEQTNVIRLPLQEGIGGFTEIFKNRIVLPFEGNYQEFYHVLKHEMTHAVVFDMLFGEEAANAATRQVSFQFPLWVNEGLAEYSSLGWDLPSEFFMIDATTFGYVAPPIADFGGFLAYKGGQLFLHFMDKAYGKGTVTRFIKALAEDRDLPHAFKRVTKTSLEEAGEIWLRELRYLYWPELGQRQYGKTVARQLTHHGKDNSFYNLQPSLSPDGQEIAFFSDRESWEAIYVLNVKTEKVTRTVIQGGKGSEHESFHSFKSAIAWSPDGKQLAVVSKRDGRDVIHLIDTKKGHVKRVVSPDVQAILSPDWSRDGKWLAFSGMKEGLTDLFLYEIETGEMRQLTHDLAHDDKPVFSPTGKFLAFESDRSDTTSISKETPEIQFKGLLPFKDVYRIELSTGKMEKVAGGRWDDKMPTYGPNDSTLAFVSNRSGIDNIYLASDSGGSWQTHPISNLLTGCFTPAWSRDGKSMAFSLFEAGGWDIYLMKDPLSQIHKEELPRTRFIQVAEDSTQSFFRPIAFANLESYKPDSGKAEEKKGKKKKKQELKKIQADSVLTLPSTGNSRDTLLKGQVQSDSLKTLAQKASNDTVTDSTESEAQAEKRRHRHTPFLMDSSQYIAEDGTFRKRSYRPKFSLDNANAALGVDNYYGAGGLAYITMSDLMGDQEIATALSINGSWENTNGEIVYSYLPLKPDFSVTVFHQAQQSSGRFAVDSSLFDSTYLDRRYGFGAGVSYPFSTFTRLETDFSTLFRSHEVEGGPSDGSGATTKTKYPLNAFETNLAFVQDNTQWGIVGPVNGQRMRTEIRYVPPVLQNKYSFYVAETDLRKYWEFGKKYTLAARVSTGLSEGVWGYENPHVFWVGGEDLALYAHYNPNNVPRKIEEWYFSQFDFPLRGYDFFEFSGTRKFISNLEFRFPFIEEFTVVWPIPFSIRYVMGNVLIDYGGAWSSGNAFREMGLGWGYGMRLNLGIFVLKYTHGESVGGLSTRENHMNSPREYWSLGAEF